MRSLHLREKRFLAAIYLVALLFVAGNHYLGWGMLGQADRIALSIVMFVGVLAYFGFAPRILEEMRAEDAVRRETDDAAERMRDKSNDAAESDELRHAIGMPPDRSLERTREE